MRALALFRYPAISIVVPPLRVSSACCGLAHALTTRHVPVIIHMLPALRFICCARAGHVTECAARGNIYTTHEHVLYITLYIYTLHSQRTQDRGTEKK